ncbi:domain-containing [Pyrenophora seminiperda CCB06]|uniref:Domain-containing n=1 Tax=Pyrenophora seminiperda CCB06 TaxID=1302712 RepID=A0A3M7MD66_9PLEO|nr:domain-containing [Pyrenophora seminiperda CCB06]
MLSKNLYTIFALAIQASSAAAYLEPPPSTAAPDTVSDCSNWHVVASGDTCDSIAKDWYISTDTFKSYNPSVGSTCKLVTSNSYCTERSYGVPIPDPTTTSTPTSSTKPTPTNGITTPTPIREGGMVNNCNKFYYVVKDDNCYNIAAAQSITLDQFYAWNSAVGTSCQTLWPEVYVCVGIIGLTTTPSPTPTPVPSSTIRPSSTKPTPTNGIATPTPIQAGMISTCDEFYLVQDTDNCYNIAQNYKISLDQFYAWNPAVGNTCATLWPRYYVCVSLIGISTLTTSTRPATTAKPTSTQPWSMPPLCTIDLSKGEYVCPSATPAPTTTKTGNGIATPTPIQAGMTNNCKKFHKVVKGDGCWDLANTYKIDLNNFYKWNPAVGSSCGALWVDNYVCVGI